MAVKYVDDGGPDGSVFGQSASKLIAFYNGTPVAQRTGAGMTQLTVTYTASNGFGFTTSAAMVSIVAQIEEIRATIMALGLHG
jgi:hypothetical protein